jgi:hypothetical protein
MYCLIHCGMYEGDWQWLQQKCIEFSTHSDPNIRGTAALCLGYIVEFHRALHTKTVVPILHKLRKDGNGFVAGYANTALDSIRHWVRITKHHRRRKS